MEPKTRKLLILGGPALFGLVFFGLSKTYFDSQRYTVLSSRMAPSFPPGAIVEVKPAKTTQWRNMKRGTVVFLKSEYTDTGKERIGRIIALPGEVFELKNSIVVVNGNQLVESYKSGTAPSSGELEPVKLSVNEYIVMGDNRNTYPPVVDVVTIHDINKIVIKCVQNCESSP